MPRIVKRDGSREPFNEDKLRAGMLRALEKRPVGMDAIEASLNELKFALRLRGEREVAAQELGSLVMDALRALDDVAYVRFASVYRDFQDVSEFQEEIERLGRSDGEPKA